MHRADPRPRSAEARIILQHGHRRRRHAAMALNHAEEQEIASVRLTTAEKRFAALCKSALPVEELIGEIVWIRLKADGPDKPQQQKEIYDDESAHELSGDASYR